jgi:flagellar hook-associated protein 2
MAYDILTTSGINSLINSYINNEVYNKVTPLDTRKTKYTTLSSTYAQLLSKIDTFKSKLSVLKATGNSSAFAAKKAESTNTTALSATASTGAQAGSYSLRVNQLAKSDLLISLDKASTGFSSITTPGTYSFAINTGDGEGGQFTSNVNVTLEESDFTSGQISFKDLATKISSATNKDKAVVESNQLTGSTASSGSFTIDIDGEETTINYESGTYEEAIDSIISQLDNVDDIQAEKVVNGSNVQLKLTVTSSSKYISINGDTGTLVSEMGIGVDKEKGASGLVTASSFSPASGLSQISLTAKNTGSGYSIENISDLSGGLLQEFGLNIGSNRPDFVQNESGTDTAGFVYQYSQLNSKLEFNGLNIERNSNSISDLVSGVTLNLKSVMLPEDSDVEVHVSNDTEAIKAKLDEFIKAFNDIYTYIKTNSASSDGNRGVLIGDSSASALNNLLSTAAYSPVSGLSGSTVNSLTRLGITFNISSGLSISDSSQLEDLLSDNVESVEQLFNSENGLANTLYDRLKPYTGSTGYLTRLKSNVDENINYLNDSITRVKTKIDKDSTSLRNQYIQLQSQLSELLMSQGIFDNSIYQ